MVEQNFTELGIPFEILNLYIEGNHRGNELKIIVLYIEEIMIKLGTLLYGCFLM